MKRHIQDSLTVFVASVVFFAVFLPTGRARADLIAHWSLDESGEDFVGGFDGVESGGVEFGVEGANDNTGDAANFFDGMVDVPFAEDLNPEDFTITAWARSTGGSGGYRSVITSRYDGIVFGGGNLDGFIIYANPSDQWQFWTGDGESAVDGWDSLAGPQVELDEWQHLAITFDSETGTKNFYVNGFLEATDTTQGYQAVTNEDRTLHIGGGGDMGDQYRWVGDIDDVGLWDEVLSEDDIIDIMENGVAGEGMTCVIRRALSTALYAPGETVTVTLTARSISGATTVTDAFPQGWTVTDDGGGTVAGDTIAFSFDADGERSYQLTPPDGVCEEVALSGTYSGAGDCTGDVGGDSSLTCDPALFACSVTRAIAPGKYVPGDTVDVTLSAANITGATTITDTFPEGWTVANDGGGTVAGNTIAFSVDADGDVSYQLSPPDDDCQDVSFSGTYANDGGCSGDVDGAVQLRCGLATLIAHWPLDDSAEDIISGFEGVESGIVEFGVAGANDNTGDAASFFDSAIDVPFDEELNPQDFTITVWARSTGGSGGYRSVITSRYDGIVFGGGNLDGFIIYANPSDQWQFWTGDGESAADGWDSLTGPPVALDEWQHLAITFDSETGTKNFYVNGILEATDTTQGYQPVTNEERALHIGGGGDMGDQYRWVGDIDDLGIWDGVLSEDDILDVMEEGVMLPGVMEPQFRRGDANGDGKLDLTDGVAALNYLFTGGVELTCEDAADTNDDGTIAINDPIAVFNYLFGGGNAPPPPGPSTCGVDPTDDPLTCAAQPSC